jgi:hypothetical protein
MRISLYVVLQLYRILDLSDHKPERRPAFMTQAGVGRVRLVAAAWLVRSQLRQYQEPPSFETVNQLQAHPSLDAAASLLQARWCTRQIERSATKRSHSAPGLLFAWRHSPMLLDAATCASGPAPLLVFPALSTPYM